MRLGIERVSGETRHLVTGQVVLLYVGHDLSSEAVLQRLPRVIGTNLQGVCDCCCCQEHTHTHTKKKKTGFFFVFF